jgi:hypothetical protein
MRRRVYYGQFSNAVIIQLYLKYIGSRLLSSTDNIYWITFLLTMSGILRKMAGFYSGGVPEWPKGSDCKSDGSAFGGSNPPPSTIYKRVNLCLRV